MVALDAALLLDLIKERAGFLPAGDRWNQAHALSVGHNCEVQKIDPARQVLLHKCNIVAGDSGGPILARVNGTYTNGD